MNTTHSNALPTSELHKDTPPVFRNDPDEKPPATLTDPQIAKIAFHGAFADKLGDPGIGMSPVEEARLRQVVVGMSNLNDRIKNSK